MAAPPQPQTLSLESIQSKVIAATALGVTGYVGYQAYKCYKKHGKLSFGILSACLMGNLAEGLFDVGKDTVNALWKDIGGKKIATKLWKGTQSVVKGFPHQAKELTKALTDKTKKGFSKIEKKTEHEIKKIGKNVLKAANPKTQFKKIGHLF